MGNPKLTVIIPTNGLHESLASCLRYLNTSLIKADKRTFDVEVMVADGSEDVELSLELVKGIVTAPGVTTSFCEVENYWTFSEIMNKTVEITNCNYVLSLNNDAYLSTDFFSNLVLFDCIVGFAQLFPLNGNEDPMVQTLGYALSQPNRFLTIGNGLPFSAISDRSVHKVAAVQMSCTLLPVALFNDLGGFSTDYRWGCEDIDLCFRAWEKGYQVTTDRSLEVYHVSGASKDLVATQPKTGPMFNLRTLSTNWLNDKKRMRNLLKAFKKAGVFVS